MLWIVSHVVLCFVQEEEVDGPVGQLTMTEIKENLATLQQNVEEKEKVCEVVQ